MYYHIRYDKIVMNNVGRGYLILFLRNLLRDAEESDRRLEDSLSRTPFISD
jgi:hypothetical protein